MADTVWFDAERENFWRLPDALDVPEGDTEIRNLSGARRQVDAQAISDKLIDKDQARHAIVEQLRVAASTAGRALGAIAHNWLDDAQAMVPDGVSLADMEDRLGPMEAWLDRDKAKETFEAGAESVRRTAKQAQDTFRRTSRVAGSAMRSARVVGKVMMDNPELAVTAGKVAKGLAKVSGQIRKAAPKREE